jgi:hypothetical protein
MYEMIVDIDRLEGFGKSLDIHFLSLFFLSSFSSFLPIYKCTSRAKPKKIFCAFFPRETLCYFPCLDFRRSVLLQSFAFCVSVLGRDIEKRSILHYTTYSVPRKASSQGTRRKLLIYKDLRQIWPARLVVSPYAIRVYV